MLLRQILASTCRQKILEALAKIESTHMMDLVRRTNSTYNQIDRNLRILVKEGIVKVNHYGRVRIIRLDRENEKTLILLKALFMLNKPVPNSQEQFSFNKLE